MVKNGPAHSFKSKNFITNMHMIIHQCLEYNCKPNPHNRVYIKPSGCALGDQHIAFDSSFKRGPCTTCYCRRAGLYGRLVCQRDVQCMGRLRRWRRGHVRKYGLQQQGCRYKENFIPFGKEAAVSTILFLYLNFLIFRGIDCNR